ncbi:hypothetical protein AMTRI_Chr05g73520 [Amborella trichopoda]
MALGGEYLASHFDYMLKLCQSGVGNFGSTSTGQSKSSSRCHPALIGRHRPFPVTHQAAARWLHHMNAALDSTSNIDPDSKLKMKNFFGHTAFFLVAGDEMKNRTQRFACKHGAAKAATM